jgi:CheY-like chemotaxis protein
MISVLYVDDEPALLEITKLYMERTGSFTVETSLSAADALKKLEVTGYDAVISDYQMPGMNGLAFLTSLRSTYPTLPFILFTGKGREEVAIEALNSGADFYLQKGGEPRSQFAELENKILQATKRRTAERALVASEEKYRELVENINDVLYSIDELGLISYISPMVSQFDLQVTEITGKPFFRFVHPDDLPELTGRFEDIRRETPHPLSSGSLAVEEDCSGCAVPAGELLTGNSTGA